MKSFTGAALIIASVSVDTQASAQSVLPVHQGDRQVFNGVREYHSPADLRQIHLYRLNKLRDEALRQQRADGGTLRESSKAELQAKLNRINAAFTRDLKRNDPLSVDQFGAPIADKQ
ncbi:hypothetical protein [Sphingomonas jeddahensis]|uniref:Uncharacterized protein n=1 Tax=Sphingomonas jeddahensis TaxID=1915074 RepID=A0A1V2EYH6_9SPHN|nr:hypothetical protein [Sphingomonas jeddahensis]ONF97567.1 hypothetical protein SPHI_01970 [Sphingomonas jeddahensis]